MWGIKGGQRFPNPPKDHGASSAYMHTQTCSNAKTLSQGQQATIQPGSEGTGNQPASHPACLHQPCSQPCSQPAYIIDQAHETEQGHNVQGLGFDNGLTYISITNMLKRILMCVTQ